MKQLSQLAQVLFILVASFAVYSFVAAARDGERRRLCTPLCHLRPDYANRNRSAPDFDVTTEAGGRLRLHSLRGKVVVLNFWTKNCRPCLEEMPSLAQLATSLKGRDDVVVVTVSTDESAEDVRGTLRSVLGAPPPFVTGVDPEAKIVRERYGTHLYPETWVIDPRGIIRARFDGPRDWSSPVVYDLIERLREPLFCSAEFEQGRPIGSQGDACDAS